MIRVGFKTDRGQVRKENQDACFVLHSQNVFLLADGVGGGNSGSLASKLAVSHMAQRIKDRPVSEYVGQAAIKEYMEDLMETANATIIQEAMDKPENMGMATTLTACAVVGKMAYFIHIGDSRAYLIRGGEMIQITEDHSYVNDLLKRGLITPEEAEQSTERHKITRALGADRTVEPDFYSRELEDNDLILLCSDGLYGEVDKEEIIDICLEEEDMTSMANSLVERANYYGGYDNISVICIAYGEGERHG